MNIERIKGQVVGRWGGILSTVGAELREDGKHQPCPICGGTDRFRFDDKDGTGTWICGQCGAGDGWKLYQKLTGIGFVDAAKQIASIVGEVDPSPAVSKPKGDPRKWLTEVWRSSKPISGNDAATKYLRGRGLVWSPQNLRFGHCYESDSKKRLPAMIGVVMNRAGKLVTLHRTYLDGSKKADIASPKKLMPATVERLSECGAAVRLFQATDVVGVAEGIETAIACKQLFDVPTWATISTSIMVGFEPPEGIRKVVVFGDCDSNFAGQKAAYQLANNLYRKDYIVDVQIPSIGDWADEVERNMAHG